MSLETFSARLGLILGSIIVLSVDWAARYGGMDEHRYKIRDY